MMSGSNGQEAMTREEYMRRFYDNDGPDQVKSRQLPTQQIARAKAPGR